MLNLPCLNPYCRSHGKPHPNCRCYDVGGEMMAEGGEAKSFCSTSRMHKPDCEYFYDGGQSGDVFAPPTQDELSSVQPSQPQDAFSAPPSNDEILQAKYTSPTQQALTAAEGVGQGFAGPLATAAELGFSSAAPMLGLQGTTAQDIANRAKANPNIHSLGEIAGLVGGAATGTGLGEELSLASNLVASKLPMLSKLGSAVLKAGVWGAAKTGSDEITNAMLGQGDPSAPVSSALANMGASALVNGFFGGAGEIAGSAVGSGIDKTINMLGKDSNIQMGTRIQQFLGGMGYANKTSIGQDIGVIDPDLLKEKAFQSGIKTYQNLKNAAAPGIGGSFLLYKATKGYDEDGAIGAVKGVGEGIATGLATALGVKTIEKYAVPALLNVATSAENPTIQNFYKVLNYAKTVGDGAKRISDGVNSLFQPIANQFLGTPERVNKIKDLVKQNISNGGLTQNMYQQLNQDNNQPQQQPTQGFAEGGEVEGHEVEHESLEQLHSKRQALQSHFHTLFDQGKHDEADKVDDEIEKVADRINKLHSLKPANKAVPGLEAQPQTPMEKGEVAPLLQSNDPIQNHFPEQNTMLQAARARISNYLSQQQPQQHPRQFAFDRKPDQTMQERSYDKALTLAVDPMSVFKKMKEGRLTQEDMTHFSSMYPELHDHLKKKITERIIQAQINGEKPPAHIRQSMSLFMGAPMDASLSQPMMAAAQATFAPQQPQMPPSKPVTKNKKSTSSLSKVSEQYQTSTEAAAMRGQSTE